jgi:hypothetical protein
MTLSPPSHRSNLLFCKEVCKKYHRQSIRSSIVGGRKWLFLALLALPGCANQPTTDYDTETTREVRIVWHKTEKAWAVVVRQYGAKLHNVWHSNGTYVVMNGVCHVYAPDPPLKNGEYVNGQWGTLGHEVKHCFDGQFHK